MKSPLEREVGKEKAPEKCHRSSGKESNKHLQQQSEHTTREDPEDWKDISVCFSFHTHLSPDLNRATLIRKMQRLSTLLLPSKQTRHRNPYLQYSPLLGACLELVSISLNSKLELKSSWTGSLQLQGY